MDGEAFKRKRINWESKNVGHLFWICSIAWWQGLTQIYLYFLEAHGFTQVWQTVPQICEIGEHHNSDD